MVANRHSEGTSIPRHRLTYQPFGVRERAGPTARLRTTVDRYTGRIYAVQLRMRLDHALLFFFSGHRRNKNKEKIKSKVYKNIRTSNKKTCERKIGQKTNKSNTNKEVKLHHLKRERVLGDSRRMHFPSREILRAFVRGDVSIQPSRSPNAGPKDGLGWRLCQQPCHSRHLHPKSTE